ncbi:MAG: VOC family protein [Dehalococcoidia bacterium]
MARIRHIAIATQDPEATARFYMEGLGLEKAGQVDSPLAEGYYLTDGHVNVAILRFKDDEAATTEGVVRHTGVHHLGFQVDNLAEGEARVQRAGAVLRDPAGSPLGRSGHQRNFEVKFTGPDGVTVDLSEHGWAGTDT